MDTCIARKIHIYDQNPVEKRLKVVMIVAGPFMGPATIMITEMECIYDFRIKT